MLKSKRETCPLGSYSSGGINVSWRCALKIGRLQIFAAVKAQDLFQRAPMSNFSGSFMLRQIFFLLY